VNLIFGIIIFVENNNSLFHIQVVSLGGQEHHAGSVDLEKVESIALQLNYQRPVGVKFAISRDIVPILTGGTCSAMSFQFLQNCILLGKKILCLSDIQFFQDSYIESSQNYRNVQFAFNGIEKVEEETLFCEDFKRAKIDGMLRYYQLITTDAFEEFRLDTPEVIKKNRKDF
jgi:hypothetical protein